MNVFDKVFLLNLDERPDRLYAVDCELKEQGIEYERVSATRMEDGKLGLLESMRQIFITALGRGYKNVCILEDDAHFLVNNARQFVEYIFPQLPLNYHLLHLGLNLTSRPERISANILRVNTAYSTHAVCYSEEGMRLCLKMLNEQEPTAYDIMLMKHIQPLTRCYATYPMICTQRVGYSDIENREIDWSTLMTNTYAMHTKNLTSMDEIAFCNNGHLIDWTVPKIDPARHEIQNPELIGRKCDCGRFIYHEELCGCPGTKEWRVEWKENTNG